MIRSVFILLAMSAALLGVTAAHAQTYPYPYHGPTFGGLARFGPEDPRYLPRWWYDKAEGQWRRADNNPFSGATSITVTMTRDKISKGKSRRRLESIGTRTAGGLLTSLDRKGIRRTVRSGARDGR